jgi:PAS domain S-box-containing protein
MGVLVLFGWALGVAVLKSVVPGWPTMSPLTAFAFVLSGAALWGVAAAIPDGAHEPSRRWLWQGIAGAVALIALLRLCDYLMGWNLGMDRLGFQEPAGAAGIFAPTRMAPVTALGFFLVGCALCLTTGPRFSVVFQVLTLLAGLVGWLGFSRYLYGGESLLAYQRMAVHTAAALVILSAGILCTRSDAGLMALLTSDSGVGVFVRRLVPAVLVVPTLLGWLQLAGLRAGWFGPEGGAAVIALATLLILGALIWASATLVHAAHARDVARARALDESEMRFRIMADAAPVMIWMAGTDKLCNFFNKRWLEFTGRSMNQELGNGWAEGVHPADLGPCFQTYSDAFDARQEFTMEYRLRRHDGEYCSVLDIGVPRFDAGGTFAGYIGSVVDVTELKRAQQRMELVVEAAPNAMVMVDHEGHIVLLNHQTERVFGYSRAELLGCSIDVLVPNLLRSAHAHFRDDYNLAPSGRPMGAGREVHGRRRDGSEVPIDVGLSPIHTPQGTAVLASIIDITTRREMEVQTAQQRDQLAHLSRVAMLGELSGSIAHELNQPLSAILSNAQAALRFLAGDVVDLDEVRNILKDIAADDARAGEVIRRLRALLTNTEVQFHPVDVNEIALDVLKLMRHDLQLRRVAMTTDLAAGLPRVRGDRVQLQQVLINLVVNGCEAMDGAPTDRHMTLRTAAVAGGAVEVSVADRGKGIPAEQLKRIFEPFVTTKAEGMGLGLAVCRTIVAAHGGELWATNNAERGATVHLTLPAERAVLS